VGKREGFPEICSKTTPMKIMEGQANGTSQGCEAGKTTSNGPDYRTNVRLLQGPEKSDCLAAFHRANGWFTPLLTHSGHFTLAGQPAKCALTKNVRTGRTGRLCPKKSIQGRQVGNGGTGKNPHSIQCHHFIVERGIHDVNKQFPPNCISGHPGSAVTQEKCIIAPR
jgi:hypothetical protein